MQWPRLCAQMLSTTDSMTELNNIKKSLKLTHAKVDDLTGLMHLFMRTSILLMK